MSNKCLNRDRQNKKSSRMTETSFVDFIKYANSNKIWILTLFRADFGDIFGDFWTWSTLYFILSQSYNQVPKLKASRWFIKIPPVFLLNPNHRFLNENEVLLMNLNSRLTLSSILITVLPRDSLLFNERLTVIIILIFKLLVSSMDLYWDCSIGIKFRVHKSAVQMTDFRGLN